MPFQIIREDVVHAKADVIVNPASRTLRPTGGASSAIFQAAGATQMRAACEAIGGCPPGDAVLTPGFNLPAKWVIHAVGPLWLGGFHGEEAQLVACYRKALTLAVEKSAASIVLPLISTGAYSYPKEKSFRVALGVVAEFLEKREMDVYLSVFDPKAARPDPIDYAALLATVNAQGRGLLDTPEDESPMEDELPSLEDMLSGMNEAPDMKAPAPKPMGGFMARAMEILREKGLDERTLCWGANMSRRYYLALRDRAGEPDKRAALALCAGLGLTLGETRALLGRAGYDLLGRDRADVIAAWHIDRGEDIFALNAALYAFGEAQLVFL